jgi:two-component system nitrogen regulation sensor histidine kinase NtrY
LKCGKEVGSKLLHEIKNPLTPIRLSAERILKKYNEDDADLDSIIRTGTETIIEEVDMLKHILGEFSRYTRMPELKQSYENINSIIEASVDSFHGHEHIHFELKLDMALPELWIDKILIRQMFANIIKNAVEAMNERGTRIYTKCKTK